jgi:hypothetical protein
VNHYAAIDVSLELSSVCIVDAAGKVVTESKVETHPGDANAIREPDRRRGDPIVQLLCTELAASAHVSKWHIASGGRPTLSDHCDRWPSDRPRPDYT